MGGFFGVASEESCIFDLFFGTDYHSHLGTRRAGMATYGPDGFSKSLKNIENTPFRTRFEDSLSKLTGNMGIGCISDFEAQPILVRSHHGSFAITTVSKINNSEELVESIIKDGTHFFEMSNGDINSTELVAALINQKDNLIDGIQYALDSIDGSLSMLILTPKGIYAARDKMGRTPVILGKKEGAICACFESYSFNNLGYQTYKELGPGEVVVFDAKEAKTLVAPGKDKKICTFLWVYYGYPTASYEGVNVEAMRYKCGELLAKRDKLDGIVDVDTVAGVPDSGIAHAVGYANASGIPFSRPFIKYTPTWPRSFMPVFQEQRNLVARMKLLPVKELIEDKKMLLIDDSIVRGTQLRETAEYLYESGAKEVHVRPACPPIVYNCKYLNFSRNPSEMTLESRKIINQLEGREVTDAETLDKYTDPTTQEYANMLEGIRQDMGFTTLRYHRLDDLLESVGLDKSQLCTYCWNGKE